MLRRRIAERKRRARLNTKDSEENGDEWIIDDDLEITEDTSELAPESVIKEQGKYYDFLFFYFANIVGIFRLSYSLMHGA